MQMEESQAATDQDDPQQGPPSAILSTQEVAPTWESAEQKHSEGDRVFVEGSHEFMTVSQGIRALLGEMENLRRDFEAKVKYDESKERVIESLHRELQLHREGLHFRVLRPAFLDMISLYDDMGRLMERMSNEVTAASDQVRLLMQHVKVFQETVEEILRRNGLESFTLEEDLFLPNKQRSLKTIPTPDPSLDRRIARRVRRGFAYEDMVLRHEIVEIYRYVPVSE